jgi:uncharacterized protein YeaO (DUF488 family)
MTIALKRAYDEPSKQDGHRILVDRVWPRGVSKEDMEIEDWLKEVAPSDSLRKSFHSGDLVWNDFRNAYLSELKNHREDLRRLVDISQGDKVTLVFSASDREHNNAVVLMQYLKMLGASA